MCPLKFSQGNVDRMLAKAVLGIVFVVFLHMQISNLRPIPTTISLCQFMSFRMPTFLNLVHDSSLNKIEYCCIQRFEQNLETS